MSDTQNTANTTQPPAADGYIGITTRQQLAPAFAAAKSGALRENMHEVYDLVPWREIADSYARHAEKGAKKYTAWNWAAGLPRVQLCASLLRHIWDYMRGIEADKDGNITSDAILWNAVALVHNIAHGLEDGRRIDPHIAKQLASDAVRQKGITQSVVIDRSDEDEAADAQLDKQGSVGPYGERR